MNSCRSCANHTPRFIKKSMWWKGKYGPSLIRVDRECNLNFQQPKGECPHYTRHPEEGKP